jgi:dTDP-4-amino-4,6-dideoxygalactose transaminase
MLETKFAPWPCFSEEEVEAVARVIRSNRVNYWTGDECRRFEAEFAAWAGTKYAVALSNGTVALDVALHALGVGRGDEVIVTPRTFIASVSCVVNAGAAPVFADVDPDSGNVTAQAIQAVLTPRTKAIVCVHLGGWPCDMDPIMTLAERHGLAVIEDCAQAHGARYRGRSVGSIGHVGAWSFCQDKIMTTGGEGGMVTTNDEQLWRRMWAFKDHGKSYSAVYERQHPPGFRWLHDSFGTNWRMLEVQGAIGRLQLRRMAEWTERRRANAATIAAACAEFPCIRVPPFRCGPEGCLPGCAVDCRHANYRCYVYVDADVLRPGTTRDGIVDGIRAEGVPCFQGSCSEVYLERAFDGTGWRPPQRLPEARALGETSLAFLVHPTLRPQDLEATLHAIRKVLSSVSR